VSALPIGDCRLAIALTIAEWRLNCRLMIGNWQLATGNWQLATGNW
jgi:hypothetical protein